MDWLVQPPLLLCHLAKGGTDTNASIFSNVSGFPQRHSYVKNTNVDDRPGERAKWPPKGLEVKGLLYEDVPPIFERCSPSRDTLLAVALIVVQRGRLPRVAPPRGGFRREQQRFYEVSGREK